MNLKEKEIKKLLNREKIEEVIIDKHEIIIVTEDKEIVIASVGKLHVGIRDREFIE